MLGLIVYVSCPIDITTGRDNVMRRHMLSLFMLRNLYALRYKKVVPYALFF